MDLRGVSKVELHRHLEGAIRLETIIDLSRQAGLWLPAWTSEEMAPYALVTTPSKSLEEALKSFAFAQGCIRSYEAVRRIAREAVEDLDTDGVRLAELRFSPDFLCRAGGLDWDAAMDALLQGLEDAAGRNVAVGLIAVFSRDYGPESADRTVAFALRHADHLVGFDIAGSEVGFPPRDYEDVVDAVRDSGLGLTTHYGESGPPEYVREAAERLRPTRIGHGLATARDHGVQDLVTELGITLEMCPTSNYLTSGVPDVAAHPCLRLLHEGVRVTLNTDDPGLFGIDLTHEWEAARDRIGFAEEDLRLVTENALAASFLPAGVKAAVRARHFDWLEGKIDSG